MKVEYTGRGFEIIHFQDANGIVCSLQQSSLADFSQPGTSAIWLGAGDDRMHLRLVDVVELTRRLNNWLAAGSFQEPSRSKVS